MQYKVSKSILGRHTVAYGCPRCGAELTSPLEEAGQVATCPSCQHQLATPGSKEFAQLRDAAARERKRREEEQRLRDLERAANFKLQEDADRKRKEERQRYRRASEGSPSVADRFLNFAFAVGKIVSVLVVGACFVAIMVCIVLLAAVREDRPRAVAGAFQPPTTGEYRNYLNAIGVSTPRGEGPLAGEGGSRLETIQDRYEEFLAEYQLNTFERQMEFIRLDREDQEALLASLRAWERSIAQLSPKAKPEAVSWYIRSFLTKREAWRREQELDERAKRLATAEAAGKRWSLTLTIGGAVAALISFLFLPLLIQIEQHARKLGDHLRASPSVTPTPAPARRA